MKFKSNNMNANRIKNENKYYWQSSAVAVLLTSVCPRAQYAVLGAFDLIF